MRCIFIEVDGGMECKNCGQFIPRLIPKLIATCEKAPQTPSKMKQILSYAQSTSKWIAEGSPTRIDEEVNQILNICKECPFYNLMEEYCTLCGCAINNDKSGMLNKVRRSTENCPDNPPKW